MPKGKLYLQEFASITELVKYKGWKVFNSRGQVYIEDIKFAKHSKDTDMISYTYVKDAKPMLLTSCFVKDFARPMCYFPQNDEDLQFVELHQNSMDFAETLLPRDQRKYFQFGMAAIFGRELLMFHEQNGKMHLRRDSFERKAPPLIVPPTQVEDEEEEFGV